MAKVFAGFPGQAVGKGNALVIEDTFQPGAAPVDVSGTPGTPPVSPTTVPAVDPATGLPAIPVDDVLFQTMLAEEDIPDQVPAGVLDFLF